MYGNLAPGGGGGPLKIYWWGCAVAHKKGVLGTDTTPKRGVLGTGTSRKWGVLGTARAEKGGGGVLGTGTTRGKRES